MPEFVKPSEKPVQQKTAFNRVKRLGLRRILLLVETFCLLLLAKIALHLLPIEKILNWKTTATSSFFRRSILDEAAECRLIRWAVTAVSDRSPISFVCFPQSIVARVLLHRRGINTQLFYGVAREQGVLITHTWLQALGKNVVGGEVAHKFSILQIY